MFRVIWRFLAVLLGSATLVAAPLASLHAQNGEQKPAEHGKGETKDGTARTDEVAEASRVMSGPAARGECVWLGERAVGLMWKDDLDTAFRHLELYDRFGCPGEHVQISFRCVVRQGNIDQKDQKAADAFNSRVHSCWLNPALPPVTATAPAAAAEKPGTK
ncbi:MAG TPA: beta-1-3, beta-1-6-glucan biosynthesis protein [Xanthobacteraceae bacterium]|nr:beta-1-3, beta-1-6-glucan biosynthesis protein [Xanthobacteraceae bacterium]